MYVTLTRVKYIYVKFTESLFKFWIIFECGRGAREDCAPDVSWLESELLKTS